MFLLWLLLVVAAAPTGFFDTNLGNQGPYPANLTSPARCFFDPRAAEARFNIDDIPTEPNLTERIAREGTHISILVLIGTFWLRSNRVTRVNDRHYPRLATVHNIRRYLRLPQGPSNQTLTFSNLFREALLVDAWDSFSNCWNLLVNLIESMLSEVRNIWPSNAYYPRVSLCMCACVILTPSLSPGLLASCLDNLDKHTLISSQVTSRCGRRSNDVWTDSTNLAPSCTGHVDLLGIGTGTMAPGKVVR